MLLIYRQIHIKQLARRNYYDFWNISVLLKQDEFGICVILLHQFRARLQRKMESAGLVRTLLISLMWVSKFSFQLSRYKVCQDLFVYKGRSTCSARNHHSKHKPILLYNILLCTFLNGFQVLICQQAKQFLDCCFNYSAITDKIVSTMVFFHVWDT